MSRSRPRFSARHLRERTAHAADERQVEPVAGDLYQDPRGCDGYCDFCDPHIYENEAIRRRMIAESPTFPLAERVLAQAGITIVTSVRRRPVAAGSPGSAG